MPIEIKSIDKDPEKVVKPTPSVSFEIFTTIARKLGEELKKQRVEKSEGNSEEKKSQP